MADFLGVGWAFPPHINARGGLSLARHERDIEEAIHMILLTVPGERVMRPEFGCRVHELIFESNDTSTEGLAAHYVEEALAMWEPRIRMVDVAARVDPDDASRLLIDIRYEIRATHDRRSLVFPFYRIPGEPASAD